MAKIAGMSAIDAVTLLVAVTVSVVVPAVAPETLRLVGLNVQETPDGSPLQAKLTVPLKPFCPDTLSVTVPDLPREITKVGELIESDMLGGGRLMV